MFKRLAVVVAFFCASASTYAGYAQLAPPRGFVSVAGGFGYAPAANDAIAGPVVRQSGGLTANVGGKLVKMDVAYRFAANAPRIAAAAIFMNPYVRAGVGIATWLGVAKVGYDVATSEWIFQEESCGGSPCTPYAVNPGGPYFSTLMEAAESFIGTNISYGNNIVSVESCTPSGVCVFRTTYGGYYEKSLVTRSVNPATINSPLTQQQMVDLLNPANQPGWPMPETVPNELPPGTILPVELPVVNPSPGVNPFPQPLFVPTGNPLPNPKYDPNSPPGTANQPFIQPGVRVVPTPTPASPFQVDLQPVDRPVASPVPVPEPVTEATAPDGDTHKEDDSDLCKTNPGIAACENGDINDVALPEVPKLYERKYPDGLIGIWNQKSDQIKQTSAFTLAAQLMPTGLVSGTCPSWPLALDFSWWASYGEYDVAPPCWIWDVAKTIIIISALMLARSLIFGG